MAYVPADADVVVAIDIKTLSDKADMNRILDEVQLDDFLSMMEMMGPTSFIQDRELTGIDFGQKMYFTAVLERQTSYAVISLIDADAFSTYLTTYDESIELESGDGYKWTDAFGFALGFSKNVLVLAGEEEELDEVFSLEADNTLSKDPPSFLAEPNDVVAWVDYGDMMVRQADMLQGQTGSEAATEMIAKMEGTSYLVKLNFNQGEVELRFVVQPGPEMTEEWSAMTEATASADLLKYTPPAPIVSGVMNMNMGQINKALMEQAAEQVEGMTDVPWAQIIEALQPLNGSAAIFVSAPEADTIPWEPHVMLALGIKDKTLTDSVIARLKADPEFSDEFELKVFEVREDVVLIASSEEALKLMGTGTPSAEVRDLCSKHPVAVHADMELIGDLLPVMMESTDPSGMMPAPDFTTVAAFMDPFSSATLTADWSDSEGSAELRLVLDDVSENSLHVLLKAIGRNFAGSVPF